MGSKDDFFDFFRRGFHTGGAVESRRPVPVIMSTPTGRHPSWPEMQYLGGTRTGRGFEWPEPEGSFERHMSASKGGKVGGRITFENVPESPLVGADFSDIERRVMAATVIPEKMARHASVSGRRLGKTEALKVEARIRDILTETVARAYVQFALAVMQTQIDEEGCGPVFAALKDWKE